MGVGCLHRVAPQSRKGSHGSKMGSSGGWEAEVGKEAQPGLLGAWRGSVEHLTRRPKVRSQALRYAPRGVNSEEGDCTMDLTNVCVSLRMQYSPEPVPDPD